MSWAAEKGSAALSLGALIDLGITSREDSVTELMTSPTPVPLPADLRKPEALPFNLLGSATRRSLRHLVKERLIRSPLFVFGYVRALRLYGLMKVPTAKGRLIIEDIAAKAIVDVNRSSLRQVDTWIDEQALSRSPVRYGILDAHYRAIDRIPDPFLNLTDYICYFASKTPDLRYLEIGLSVGRNLWQVMHSCKGATLFGLDMDNLYPVVRSRLQPISRRIIPTQHKSVRIGEPQMEEFHHSATSNSICILSGDEFDGNVWSTLQGKKFNLLFSDAMHTPDALLYEWGKLQSLQLLDPEGFTMIWDDLQAKGMPGAFETICRDACRNMGMRSDQCALLHVPGWIGRHELPHRVGIISSCGFVGR